MKAIAIIKINMASILILMTLAACKSHDLSLVELQKEKWDSVGPGASYISTKNEKDVAAQTDSIQLALIAMSGKSTDLIAVSVDTPVTEISPILSGLLNKKAINSQSGSLRFSLREMSMNDLSVRVFMRYPDDISPGKINEDSLILTTISGVESVDYVSKEETRKIYLGEKGNEDWAKVLDSNPLPSSFTLRVAQRRWVEKEMIDLQNTITEKIYLVSDVSYPKFIFRVPDQYYFFRYDRIKK